MKLTKRLQSVVSADLLQGDRLVAGRLMTDGKQ